MKKKRGGGHVFPDSLPARSAKPSAKSHSSCWGTLTGQLTF